MTTAFLLAHGATNTLIRQPGVDYDGITFAEIIARVKERAVAVCERCNQLPSFANTNCFLPWYCCAHSGYC